MNIADEDDHSDKKVSYFMSPFLHSTVQALSSSTHVITSACTDTCTMNIAHAIHCTGKHLILTLKCTV